MIIDLKTGKRTVVEPIDETPYHKEWGDINPSTKELEGEYGKKYKGSVTEEESIITEENGFDNIRYTGKGVSPFGIKED
jgi:hypothetical protein